MTLEPTLIEEIPVADPSGNETCLFVYQEWIQPRPNSRVLNPAPAKGLKVVYDEWGQVVNVVDFEKGIFATLEGLRLERIYNHEGE